MSVQRLDDAIDQLKKSIDLKGPNMQRALVFIGQAYFQKGEHEQARYAWESVLKINDWQKRRFADQVVNAFFNTINDKVISVLGFAFKKDTNDTRKSPAIDICKRLLEERATLNLYDPKVESEKIFENLGVQKGNPNINLCANSAETFQNANAIIILTEWDEFKEINFEEALKAVSYTHLRAHETRGNLVCPLLL